MSKHCCIVGGNAELAWPLIAKWLMEGHKVSAVCHNQPVKNPRVEVYTGGEYPSEPVHLLVTMPGCTIRSRIERIGPGEWDKVLDSCLTSVAKALGNVLLVNDANVVVVGSIIGSSGGFGCSAYAAAKAGLLGLVRAAANEWAARGVCVNLLELGYCNAGMGSRLDEENRQRAIAQIPLRRFAEPYEVVEAIDYLSRVRYMTGNVLTLAGGMR